MWMDGIGYVCMAMGIREKRWCVGDGENGGECNAECAVVVNHAFEKKKRSEKGLATRR